MTQPITCQSILSKTIIRTSTKEAYFANMQKRKKRVGKVHLYRHLFHFFLAFELDMSTQTINICSRQIWHTYELPVLILIYFKLVTAAVKI